MHRFLRDIDKQWTLFLDRDGVINRRLPGDYVRNIRQFVFLPGVKESIARMSEIFGKIVVVTNQQGIGKGWMTSLQLEEVHRYMVKEIEKAGGRIDAVFHCPDLQTKAGNCRKPATFLFEQAKERFPEIDPSKSVMVGDSESDIRFGKNAGMFTVFVGGTHPLANVCIGELPDLLKMITEI